MSEMKPDSVETEERLLEKEQDVPVEDNDKAYEDSDKAYEDGDKAYEDDDKAYEERKAARQERRRREKRKRRNRRIVGGILVTAVAAIGVGVGFYGDELQTFFKEQQVKISQLTASNKKETAENTKKAEEAEKEETKETEQTSAKVEETPAPEDNQETMTKEEKKIYKRAKLYSQQYNYDKAIKVLKESSYYETNSRFQHAVEVYQKKKDSCVSWPIDQVTHVFYHTLIADTSKAFDGDYKAADYDQVMTTIDEFNKITQSMYDKGYVMVNIYDLAKVDENGNMSAGEILLPPGKVPFVLSQDDVCYYHYMDGDGFATKLVVDEDGKIRNEYVNDDGSVSVGDYDMVPLIDRFVEEHPDFSYRGAKGIVALTGYNGILGYRTDISYETRPDDLDQNKVDWLNSHPDFNLDTEREEAKKVAQAMKEEGWVFASHTWGHLNVSQISLERLQADTQKFKENVDPLIGGTDIIIFAFGADLTGVEDYSGDKFEYLKSQGYNYYCNVDSSKYYVQLRDRYFRMGRRNLDGYRMYYNPDLLTDLFDASAVFDPARPVPVPPMGQN